MISWWWWWWFGCCYTKSVKRNTPIIRRRTTEQANDKKWLEIQKACDHILPVEREDITFSFWNARTTSKYIFWLLPFYILLLFGFPWPVFEVGTMPPTHVFLPSVVQRWCGQHWRQSKYVKCLKSQCFATVKPVLKDIQRLRIALVRLTFKNKHNASENTTGWTIWLRTGRWWYVNIKVKVWSWGLNSENEQITFLYNNNRGLIEGNMVFGFVFSHNRIYLFPCYFHVLTKNILSIARRSRSDKYEHSSRLVRF